MNCVHGVRVDRDCKYCATGTEPAKPSASLVGSVATLTEAEILKAFNAAMPNPAQEESMAYEVGPYSVTKASGFMIRFAEQLTGKRLEVK